ncbi:VOC family protein [Quadrisphaera sp. INWT6]|uniref:VOC family protein n=1 Tax=Quadrisphaera sp. INWT6 TaxID=2596917 RepID=UPI0018921A54|nr:VOC family protein [Quadrisphaera sp. INWT6]MBF5081099.1 VOC family protein [Quadrisphaera sp. INWT6]
MRTPRLSIAFDAADIAAESRFWADLLDGEVVRADDDWHTVQFPSGSGVPDICVQRAPGHVAPTWPDPAVPQQVHLDVDVEDVRAAEQEALAKGARLVEETVDLDADEGFRVYASPAGHPFCLCWGQ